MVLRIDLFLSLTGVFKTRSVAGKACRTGHVTLNGKHVLAVPLSKQVSKKDRLLYISYVDSPSGESC